MWTIISTFLGFSQQFLPELFKWLQKRGDQKHELAMFKLRLESMERQSLHRLDEVVAMATSQEQIALHTPQPSFGVQLIDAASKSSWSGWVVVPAFYLFVLVDALNNAVRSIITYAICGLYIACKVAFFYYVMLSGGGLTTAWMNLWTEQDGIILGYTFGFWFGGVTAKTVFGRNRTVPAT